MTALRRVPVLFFRERERWVAQSFYPQISTFGESLDEARAAVREALALYFEGAPDDHHPAEIRLENVVV